MGNFCCPDSDPTDSDNKKEKRPAHRWIFSDGVDGMEDVKDHLDNEYEVGNQLGQPGQFGVAFQCKRISDGASYAVKRIEKARFIDTKVGCSDVDRATYYAQFRDEIAIMREMDHPNIVKLIDVFEDPDCLYLVMEKCDGGELFDRIKKKKRYSEKDAAAVLFEFAKGIQALHQKDIAHCDLKPDNILFLTDDDDAPLKIIDFGMSKHSPAGENHITGFRGTPYYVAPEIVEKQTYTYHCDMWSFGVISFVMLFGFPPFHSRTGEDDDIYELIKQGFQAETKPGYGPWFPAKQEISESAKDLITRCLETDPVKRYSATEALEHPWVTGQSASEVPLVGLVLKNLHEFTAGCQLKAAVLDVMTDLLTDAEVANLQKTFKSIDKDGDGQITAEELRKAVETQIDSEHKGEDMKNFEEIIQMADLDGDGKLSYKELLATSVQRKMKLKEERMFAAFEKFDKDKNGFITAEELIELMAEGGKTISADEATSIIAEVDTNGDGEISEEEFMAMWTRKDAAYMNNLMGKNQEVEPVETLQPSV